MSQTELDSLIEIMRAILAEYKARNSSDGGLIESVHLSKLITEHTERFILSKNQSDAQS